MKFLLSILISSLSSINVVMHEYLIAKHRHHCKINVDEEFAFLDQNKFWVYSNQQITWEYERFPSRGGDHMGNIGIDKEPYGTVQRVLDNLATKGWALIEVRQEISDTHGKKGFNLLGECESDVYIFIRRK